MIAPGARLRTDFTLKVVRDGELREAGFGALLARRTLVSVHMKNNTPTCDRQADAVASLVPELDRAGLAVIALSRDSAGSHRRVAERRGHRHTLASDPEDRFSQAADALVEKAMYGRTFIGPLRAFYVLEPDGTVLAAERVDTADPAAQLKELAKRLGRQAGR